MKQINFFISAFLVSLLLFLLNAPVSISAGNKDTLVKEAQGLYKTSAQYVDARLQNQWKSVYSFQHPEYQKAISFEEFQYFNGYVPINYRKEKMFGRNVSGTPVYPSVEEIKRNPIQRDPFAGVPLPPVYRFIPSPLVNIADHKIEKIYLDDSGTLGKAAVRLKIVESFPPSMGAGDLKIRRKLLYVDYWEKINGKWVVAIMKQFPGFHVSGAVTIEHPVPKDMSRWDAANFTEFKPGEFK